jgi:hypothetical protein
MPAAVETVAKKVGFASQKPTKESKNIQQQSIRAVQRDPKAFSGDSFIFHLYNEEISVQSTQKHIRREFDLLILKTRVIS